MSKNKLVLEQEEPTKNEEKAVWDIVIEDMKARDAEGYRKYKTRLQSFNGRDPLVDAYQEHLDATVYTRQAIIERQAMIEVLRFYAEKSNYRAFEENELTEIELDRGEQARKMLAKLGVK